MYIVVMKIEDITILHLSDLHIGTSLNKTLYDLLDDVEIQLRHAKNLIIVVTGDFANEAQISEASESIVYFFEELKKRVPAGCKIVDIELTPGNHDVKRPLRSNKYNSKTYKFKSDEYNILARQIYALFRVKKDASGVTVVRVGNKKICFLSIDSSWYASKGEIEGWLSEELEIKKEQLSKASRSAAQNIRDQIVKRSKALSRKLVDRYRCCKVRQRPSLTIALSHFPLTWMLRDSSQLAHEFLAENGLDGVDIWLCGHAHIAQMSYTNDNNKSTVMLMTGVGRPDYNKDHDTRYLLQRYSLYQMSFERNVCSINVRVSKCGEGFGWDDQFALSRYTHEISDMPCLPLQSSITGGYISLNTSEGYSPKKMFVDGPALKTLRAIFERMVTFRIDMQHDINELYGIIRDLIAQEGCYDPKTIDKRMLESVNGINRCFGIKWKETITRIVIDNRIFIDLLQSIVGRIIESFTSDCRVNQSGLDTYICSDVFRNVDWRVHFRKYIGELSKDQKFIINDKYVTSVVNDDQVAKELPWGGVVKATMLQNEKSLVFSVSNVENHIPTQWSDFLTAIPILRNDDNVLDFKLLSSNGNVKSRKESRPLLTYAISMKISRYDESVLASKVLYLLEYCKINQVVSQIIQSFFDGLDIDTRKVIRSI